MMKQGKWLLHHFFLINHRAQASGDSPSTYILKFCHSCSFDGALSPYFSVNSFEMMPYLQKKDCSAAGATFYRATTGPLPRGCTVYMAKSGSSSIGRSAYRGESGSPSFGC